MSVIERGSVKVPELLSLNNHQKYPLESPTHRVHVAQLVLNAGIVHHVLVENPRGTLFLQLLVFLKRLLIQSDGGGDVTKVERAGALCKQGSRCTEAWTVLRYEMKQHRDN